MSARDFLGTVVSSLTNGRPMKCVRENVHTDNFNHRPINLYVDQKGRRFLSQNKWGTLRVAVPDNVTYNLKP